MEEVSLLTDFPDREEEKRYQLISSDASGNYNVFTGGTYVCIKNPKGLTVRFTGVDTNKDAITPAQIETWLTRLQKRYHHF